MSGLLAWMDLEMTGLDPAKHVIVEIATLLTDDDLNIIQTGPDLVIRASEDELALMDDVVVEMHTKSGLLDQIRASTVTLEDAARQTLEFLQAHIPEPRSVPLCGNSIGMDRRFLAVYMTEIEEFLHYRSIDVTTVKELARRWNPAALDAAPRKDVGHRALDDITESINELRYYREALFLPPPDNADDTDGAADSAASTAASSTAASSPTAKTADADGAATAQSRYNPGGSSQTDAVADGVGSPSSCHQSSSTPSS